MFKLSSIDKVSILLVIVGALLWGFYGFVGVNLIEVLFRNSIPFFERIVYAIVGLAGINIILFIFKTQSH